MILKRQGFDNALPKISGGDKLSSRFQHRLLYVHSCHLHAPPGKRFSKQTAARSDVQ